MTVKFASFMQALEQLCSVYDVQIATAGYDNLQIWDKEPWEPFLYDMYVEDRTNE